MSRQYPGKHGRRFFVCSTQPPPASICIPQPRSVPAKSLADSFPFHTTGHDRFMPAAIWMHAELVKGVGQQLPTLQCIGAPLHASGFWWRYCWNTPHQHGAALPGSCWAGACKQQKNAQQGETLRLQGEGLPLRFDIRSCYADLREPACAMGNSICAITCTQQTAAEQAASRQPQGIPELADWLVAPES